MQLKNFSFHEIKFTQVEITIRIMTSNIWGDYFNNPTHGRDEQLIAVYQKYMPDVLGFQEVTSGWHQSTLFQKLSQNYRLVGTELLESENYVPLAIKKDFSIIAKGFEYLVRTSDLSKAITWAVVRKNDLMVAVCNTHFWWMRGTESEEKNNRKVFLTILLKITVDCEEITRNNYLR